MAVDFEEDWFQILTNVHWNGATEVKPGGLVFQKSTRISDPSRILISAVVRIPTKSAQAALAAAADPDIDPYIPIFEFGISADGKVTETSSIIFGEAQFVMAFDIVGTFNVNNYDFGYTFALLAPGFPFTSTPTVPPPSSTHFTGGFPPTITFTPSSPGGTATDDTPPGASGASITGSMAPTGWVFNGQAIGSHLVSYDPHGAFANWYYKLDDYVFNTTTDTTLIPSILYFDASDNSVFLRVQNRVELNSFDLRLDTGSGSNAGEFKLGKWNHILISGSLSGGAGGKEIWSVAINGDPSSEAQFNGNPDMKLMALRGLEVGVPAVPSDLTRRYATGGPNQDLDYSSLRIWFDKSYVHATTSEVIAQFVDEDKRLVNSKVAEEAYGEPDVFLGGDARSFIKNKGGGGEFTTAGFADGTKGLIINYSPAPQFVGDKDTSKPSAKNQ